MHGLRPLRSEIAPALATHSVRYANVWEDHRLLEAGLAINRHDDVLSITSGGCNVLALLLQEPRTITAIDLNDAQSWLLELKLVGIRRLNYSDFLDLLGVGPGDQARAYERVRRELSSGARLFWDRHERELAMGVVHCGKLETYFRGFLPQLHAIHPRERVASLVAMAGGASQADYFRSHIATAAFERAFRAYFGREMMAREGRDPSQFRWVAEGDVGAHFYRRFCDVCTRLPLANNFYVQRFLTGEVADLGHGPMYLRPENFPRLKRLVGRVRVITDEVERVVSAAPQGRFSKLNLSDMFEYMSASAADQLFAAIAHALRPGGRVAYWNLLVPRGCPASLHARLRPRADLSAPLAARDRAWFYRSFHIDEAVPA